MSDSNSSSDEDGNNNNATAAAAAAAAGGGGQRRPQQAPPPANNNDPNMLRIMVSTDNHLGYAERDPVRGAYVVASYCAGRPAEITVTNP